LNTALDNLTRRGLMYVMSSPSGAGKTTITRELLKNNPEVSISISATTRPKRAGEVHGKDYYFVTPDEFRDMVENGEMLEHAKVFDNYYGTPRAPVEKALEGGPLESDAQIRGRMEKAGDEMSHYQEYDYVIINDNVEEAISKAQLIMDAERLKRNRQKGLTDFVKGLRGGL